MKPAMNIAARITNKHAARVGDHAAAAGRGEHGEELRRLRRAACERARTVPRETVEALRGTGFYKLVQPAAFGGYEQDFDVLLELVMELEEEFEITIPDDQAEKIKTVGEAIDYIERELAKK